MRISVWSSDVCSSDLAPDGWGGPSRIGVRNQVHSFKAGDVLEFDCHVAGGGWRPMAATQRRKEAGARASQAEVTTGGSRGATRSEEHTTELQSLMRISYDVFCLKKKNLTSKTKYIL